MPFGGLLTLGAVISGGSSLLSGILGSNAADTAASTQQGAEQNVLQLLSQLTPQEQQSIESGVTGANGTLDQQYSQNIGLLSPYLSTGTTALGQLNTMLNGGGFKPPTAAEAAAYPGYQFQLQQGEQAVDRSAAAAGGALGGGALKASDQYAQGLAQQDYSNVYNQALGTYNTNFGNLSGLAGLGLNATNTGVGSGNILGSESASNTFQGGLGQANLLGQNFNSASGAITGSANASAAGTIGSTNAITSGLTGAAGSLSNLLLLQQLLNRNAGSGGGSSYGGPNPVV